MLVDFVCECIVVNSYVTKERSFNNKNVLLEGTFDKESCVICFVDRRFDLGNCNSKITYIANSFSLFSPLNYVDPRIPQGSF